MRQSQRSIHDASNSLGVYTVSGYRALPMAKIRTMTVSFRVPTSWRPLIKELIEASPICQNAVLLALQKHCDEPEARALEQSLAALATGDATRFPLKTIFPKDSPNNETVSATRIKEMVKDVRRDLRAFKACLRDQ